MKKTQAQKDERRQIKEAAEIRRLEKEKDKPQGKYYLFYLLLIITLVYITDEVASESGTQMKSEIANTLFASYGSNSVGIMDIVGYLSYAVTIPALFYRTLADRYGRKLFLFINTVGMSVGMLLMFAAKSILVYAAGSVVIAFFIPHDMQVVYIFETAPNNRRATIYSAIKACATLGIFIIPLCRKFFMPDISKWNDVFLVPALLGLFSAMLALVFAKETAPFISSRLEYLKMDEEGRARRDKAEKVYERRGMINAFRFAFAHRQLRWIFISSAVNGIGTILTLYYSVILTYGYAEGSLHTGVYADFDTALNGVSVTLVTSALFVFPFASAFIQFINGRIADRIGRKGAVVLMYILSVLSFALFTFGAYHSWPPYVTGILCGILVGSYWAGGDVLGGMMVAESCPTDLRSSMLSAQTMFCDAGTGVGVISIVALIAIFGNSDVWIFCACLGIPGIIVSIFLIINKTFETKGVDISTVRGDEWDGVADLKIL